VGGKKKKKPWTGGGGGTPGARKAGKPAVWGPPRVPQGGGALFGVFEPKGGLRFFNLLVGVGRGGWGASALLFFGQRGPKFKRAVARLFGGENFPDPRAPPKKKKNVFRDWGAPPVGLWCGRIFSKNKRKKVKKGGGFNKNPNYRVGGPLGGGDEPGGGGGGPLGGGGRAHMINPWHPERGGHPPFRFLGHPGGGGFIFFFWGIFPGRPPAGVVFRAKRLGGGVGCIFFCRGPETGEGGGGKNPRLVFSRGGKRGGAPVFGGLTQKNQGAVFPWGGGPGGGGGGAPPLWIRFSNRGVF